MAIVKELMMKKANVKDRHQVTKFVLDELDTKLIAQQYPDASRWLLKQHQLASWGVAICEHIFFLGFTWGFRGDYPVKKRY